MLKFGYSPVDLSLDVSSLLGCLGLLTFIPHLLTTGYPTHTLIFTSICSFIYLVAIILYNYSVTHGLSGPTCAIVQQMSVIVTLLQFVVDGKVPRANEMVGIAMCLVGGLVISLDFKRCSGKK